MQNNLDWVFRKRKHLGYGSTLLICGNHSILGNWQLNKSIPMKWNDWDNWQVTLSLPLQEFEYKHVIRDSQGNHFWDEGENIKINLENVNRLNTQALKLMSFNIRLDTPDDGQNSWKYRKDIAIQMLLEELPSVCGVQQALKHQKQQIRSSLNGYYQYYGKARDLHQNQECGIFFLRHRFTVHGQGLVWYNQTKTPGQLGFGAKFPRNLTYLVLKDTILDIKFVIINTHFDHQSKKSQQQSVKIIVSILQQLSSKHQFDAMFLMGDFNIGQDDKKFLPLHESKFRFCSSRDKAKNTDNQSTFHGFGTGIQLATKIAKYFKSGLVIIDHIFYSSKEVFPETFKTCVAKPYVSDHYPIYATFSKIQNL